MSVQLFKLKPQTRRVLGELIARGGNGLSAKQAVKFKISNSLAARVKELRDAGVGVRTGNCKTRPGKKYVAYRV